MFYSEKMTTKFDVDDTCTWTSWWRGGGGSLINYLITFLIIVYEDKYHNT